VFNKHFDINDLEYVPAPTLAAPAPTVGEVRTAPRRARKGHFVMVPLEWVYRLSSARASGNTWTVATHLLHQSFKDRRTTIRLANGALALNGVSRAQKRLALGVLERLGLVIVERRARKSPIVTLIHL
jgi:hypothetical protein